jgi:hypothetical protein
MGAELLDWLAKRAPWPINLSLDHKSGTTVIDRLNNLYLSPDHERRTNRLADNLSVEQESGT